MNNIEHFDCKSTVSMLNTVGLTSPIYMLGASTVLMVDTLN
jgi:hypothetical protein